jgi:hypothetical protein
MLRALYHFFGLFVRLLAWAGPAPAVVAMRVEVQPINVSCSGIRCIFLAGDGTF